jgi:hypothetical protein
MKFPRGATKQEMQAVEDLVRASALTSSRDDVGAVVGQQSV